MKIHDLIELLQNLEDPDEQATIEVGEKTYIIKSDSENTLFVDLDSKDDDSKDDDSEDDDSEDDDSEDDDSLIAIAA
jgi:hypothetical protein